MRMLVALSGLLLSPGLQAHHTGPCIARRWHGNLTFGSDTRLKSPD